jgi:methionine synthase II (cobalamin-independent)
MSSFIGNLRATTIGSLPLTDAQEATDLVFNYTPLLPSWVQLPKHPGEGMLEQYNEGLPGIQDAGGRIHIDTDDPGFEQALLHFYEQYLGAVEGHAHESLERFAISRNRARGLFSFIERLSTRKPEALDTVKGQITGPFTLATGLKDREGKSAYYNPQLRDVIVKLLSLKAKWQIKKLQRCNVSVLMFMDEPSLVGFGSSAYLGVQEEDIKKDLNEIAGIIHAEQAWAGVHCCENTDWSLLLKSDIDVLNFDAYGFFDRLFLYKDDLVNFVNRGGTLAWGIVPTHAEEIIHSVSAVSLMQLWQQHVEKLIAAGLSLEKIARQSLVTPSCGTGSLSKAAALRVLELLSHVSQALRKEFGFV